jgi:hypothetical protein
MSENRTSEDGFIQQQYSRDLPGETNPVRFSSQMLIHPNDDFSDHENPTEDEVLVEFRQIIVDSSRIETVPNDISIDSEDSRSDDECSPQEDSDENTKIKEFLEIRHSIRVLLNRLDDFTQIHLKNVLKFDRYSLILDRFPDVMDQFNHEKLRLLWQGTRDGFGFTDFFKKCHGHRNTLLLIIDTRNNIFGGFTSAKWPVVKQVKLAEDSNMNSFLFTIRNPYGIPPTIFPIRPEEKAKAISYGPSDAFNFGEYDISVFGNGHQRVSFTTGFGRCYQNTTGIEGSCVFTGSYSFIIQEIEMFQVNQ